MRIIGESRLDYMRFACEACGGDVHVEFLGYDPAVPRFRFTCQRCGEAGEFKMQFQLWSGLSERPSRVRG